jgi:uncharacterized damage-inducible protein DinB
MSLAVRNIGMLTRYSAWANELLYAALGKMDALEVTRPRTGRSITVLSLLAHNYVVDLIWQAHCQGRAHGFTKRALNEPMSLEQLHTAQRTIDAWFVDYAKQQSEASLSEMIDFVYISGQAARMQRGDVLMHIVNHKTYHRGYIADMMYEFGGKPPSMDLNVFLTQP